MDNESVKENLEERISKLEFDLKSKLLHYINGRKPTDDEVESFDLENEYNLIKEKKSKLSSNQRKNVNYIYSLMKIERNRNDKS